VEIFEKTLNTPLKQMSKKSVETTTQVTAVQFLIVFSEPPSGDLIFLLNLSPCRGSDTWLRRRDG
jgi:hypothetical protein